MDPGPLRDALALASGVATGAMSGLFGVGGAVISTPAIRALGASAAVSVGTTLPAIIPGAASGTVRYSRERLIDWRLVRLAGPSGALAAVAGSLLSPVVPGHGHVLMLLTAGLLGFSAVRLFRTAPSVRPDDLADRAETDLELADQPAAPERSGGPPDDGSGPAARPVGSATGSSGTLVVLGVLAGLLSGLLGVGGGIILVPGFTQVIRLPLKPAIATSLACVALFAVPGTVTHGLQHDIDWRFALLLAVGVVPGARLGAALTMRADDRRLRPLVAGFLALTAVLYAAGEIHGLIGG